MIHFVYAVPSRTPGEWVYHRTALAAQKIGLPVSYVGRRAHVGTEGWPTRAPSSITAHVYRALSERAETRLYDVRERGVVRGAADDVLIGHYQAGDVRGIWQRSCVEGTFALRIAMNPLSHGMAEVCGELDPYVPLVDSIFGIMGPYWYDTWRDGALAAWYPKIVPFDMAIDIGAYPQIKHRFNPPGRRRFLYIGNAGAQKGTHLLSILFGLAKDQKCIAVGPTTPIANVECRPRVHFTPDYLHGLADECDFVISLGVSDANPTVLLEAMAWGFPAACTPQSGYYRMPEIMAMSTADMRLNLDVLDWLQQAPERELLARADTARALVARRYTWERFAATLIENLERLAIDKLRRPLFAVREAIR